MSISIVCSWILELKPMDLAPPLTQSSDKESIIPTKNIRPCRKGYKPNTQFPVFRSRYTFNYENSDLWQDSSFCARKTNKKCCFLAKKPKLLISSLSLFSPLSFLFFFSHSGAGLEQLSEEDTLDKHGTSRVLGMLLAPDLLPMERRRLEGWRNPGHGAEGREKTAPLFSWRVQSFSAEESNWGVLGLLFCAPDFPFHPMCQTAWKL